MFKNRKEAGRHLAKKLWHFKNQKAVVLAIPRGGVPIGKVVAQKLNLPLDIALSKKISHPTMKEYAIGAVSLETEIIDESIEASQKYIEQEVKKIRELLRQRYKKYYQGRTPESLAGKIVIIVDDGIATGYTMENTINLVRQQHPKKIVVAVPVAAHDSLQRLEEETSVDVIICLHIPKDFFSVGRFYEDFSQVSDDDVVELLSEEKEMEG